MRHSETLPTPDNPDLHIPLGGVALHGEVAFDDTNIQEEGINQLETKANRVHDIDAAHEAALIENEIFDVYDEAVQQNEIFDANAEAIGEDEASAEVQKQQQRQIKERVEALDAEQHAEEDTPTIEPNDLRGQAEAALKEAGVVAPLPVGSQVRKDAVTGNLMIIGNDDIKVLEPQLNGRTKIVDYSFDKDSGLVTISAKGANTLLARSGDYVEETRPNGELPVTSAINLPSAVAAMTGFKRAIPVR